MKAKFTFNLINRLKPAEKEYEVRDTELQGLVLRVKPSGKMVYTLVYARGKRITIGPADAIDHEQAREVARGHLAEHYKGEDPIEKRKRVQSENYLQFLEEVYRPYLSANLRKGVNNSENVKETMDQLRNCFPELHELGLNDITPLLIEKWRQRRRKEGVKPATINRQMNDLRACLNRAVKWGALAANPFDKVERTKVDSSAKVRYLTPHEELALRQALDRRETEIKAARQRANQWRAKRGYTEYTDLDGQVFVDYLKPAVLLSLNTGLRRGELFSLKWPNVDFERKNLTVAGDTAKDGETRHIPLNSEALAILRQWKQQPGVKSQWVFPGKDGAPFQNLRKSWLAVLEKAEIANFRWHDMRHHFASQLVMNGVDLNMVRELLGHSDYKMTLRYAHLAPKHKQDAVELLVATKS
jgi:integrase